MKYEIITNPDIPKLQELFGILAEWYRGGCKGICPIDYRVKEKGNWYPADMEDLFDTLRGRDYRFRVAKKPQVCVGWLCRDEDGYYSNVLKERPQYDGQTYYVKGVADVCLNSPDGIGITFDIEPGECVKVKVETIEDEEAE